MNILISQLGTRIFHLVKCFNVGGESFLSGQWESPQISYSVLARLKKKKTGEKTTRMCFKHAFFVKQDKGMSQEKLYTSLSRFKLV